MSDFVRCRLVAGNVLIDYSAVAGEEAENDLQSIREKAPKPDNVFLGVTTGNWVRLALFDETWTPHPLARGETGHGEFKQKLMEVSDEVYVACPLGKVVLCPVDTLNSIIGYATGDYREVGFTRAIAKKMRLVATTRTQPKALFFVHAAKMQALLAHQNRQADPRVNSLEKIPHLLFPFDDLADKTRPVQMDVEFPHRHTRDSHAFQELFSVFEQSS